MNINTLILLIGTLLGSIFFFFKPLAIKQNNNAEVAQLELHNFMMYEFDRRKLVDIATGEKALRYRDRDLLYNFVFNDNSNNAIVSLSADEGKYKNDTIDLRGHVLYTKSDDIEFKSEHVFYDRKHAFAKSDVPFRAVMGNSRVEGKTLYYDLKRDRIKSKDIYAVYSIQNRK